MDIGDRAQKAESLIRNLALEDQGRVARANDYKAMSHCIDCGDSIPEARQKAARGCVRCVGCAEKKEQQDRR